MAAIASAIAASAVAFLVVSRWGLAGTLTGAAIIPVVYTLVSHWSAESLDHLGRWIRRRMLHRGGIDESSEPTPRESARLGTWQHADLSAGGGTVAERQAPKRGNSKFQWSLAVFASLALAVSLYSLILSGPVEKTIVREKVIEKTVTVTIKGGTSVARAPSADTSTTTTSIPEEPGTAPTAPATTIPGQAGPEVEPSSTTTNPGPTGQEEGPAPTTNTIPITTTSLP